MANHIRYNRDKLNMTRDTLARRVGTSVSQITKLERGERKLTQDWIERLSAALNVHPVALLSAWTTEVIGQIRNGEIVYKEKGGVPTVPEVEAPSQAPESLKAIEVADNELAGFAEKGAILFFDWEYSAYGPGTNIGTMSVVWCKDKRVLIRRVFPGTSPDTWTLVPATGSPDLDMFVTQANPITWMRLPEPQYPFRVDSR